MDNGTPEWRRMRERGNSAGLGGMRWLAQHAPAWVTDPLIWLISLYFTLFPSRVADAASRDYLRRVLGRPPDLADRHRHIRSFAHVVFERVGLLRTDTRRFDIRAVNREAVLRRLAEGRGGVLLGAHFGSFEALRAYDRALPGLTVRYLMFQDNAQASTQILDRLNPEVAAQVIRLEDGPGAMLAVREALEQGHFVAFLGDRLVSRNPRAEVEADFLGDPVRLPRSPYLAAILAGVPLILCFAARLGGKTYEIAFVEIYDGAGVARGGRDAKCGELAQRFADELARMCRRHPFNWFNFYDFWR